MQTWNDIIRLANHGSPAPDKRVEKTDAEWKKELTPEQYHVTREHGTERAFTGEHCESHEAGLYACICCATPLYDSRTKFNSGTGWPSFTQPVKDNALKYKKDTSFGMTRIEVLCNTCDAHQGHAFPDGPPPSGVRLCINSAAIQLVSDKQEA